MSIDPNDIQLTDEQRSLLADQAARTGRPWHEVLSEALSKLKNGSSEENVIGLFASEPEIVDEMLKSALEARENDPLRTGDSQS